MQTRMKTGGRGPFAPPSASEICDVTMDEFMAWFIHSYPEEYDQYKSAELHDLKLENKALREKIAKIAQLLMK